MGGAPTDEHAGGPPPPSDLCGLRTGRAGHTLLTALALVFAMAFPTLAAWGYLLALSREGGHANAPQQIAYAEGKFVQFVFPVVFLLLVERRLPAWSRPRWDGLRWGLGFGLLVAALTFAAYFGVLRHSSLLARTPARIHAKLREVGLDDPAGYLGLAVFLCAAHSLLEEYYWRWFVFGRLRKLLPVAPALVLSSLAFAAHHVVVLYVFLPGRFLAAVLPAALGIAAGGGVWAALYERWGTIYPSWLSHLVVDAALFAVGWDMLARSGW